jgi:hypothetical protein
MSSDVALQSESGDLSKSMRLGIVVFGLSRCDRETSRHFVPVGGRETTDSGCPLCHRVLTIRTTGITEHERLTQRKSKRPIECFVCMPWLSESFFMTTCVSNACMTYIHLARTLVQVATVTSLR